MTSRTIHTVTHRIPAYQIPKPVKQTPERELRLPAVKHEPRDNVPQEIVLDMT